MISDQCFKKGGMGTLYNFQSGNDLDRTVYCAGACTPLVALGGLPCGKSATVLQTSRQVPFGGWLLGVSC